MELQNEILARIDATKARADVHNGQMVSPGFAEDKQVRALLDEVLNHHAVTEVVPFADMPDDDEHPPLLRWVSHPSVGYTVGPGAKDHVTVAKRALPLSRATRCDRCSVPAHEGESPLHIAIYSTAPNMIAFVICGGCKRELRLRGEELIPFEGR